MVNLALIGAGKWGQNYLKTAQKLSSICQVKYVCTRSQKIAGALPNQFIKIKNYQDLFRYKDLQGVIIATPGSNHFTIAKDFLSRGYNLLIEKPMVTNYNDSLTLYKLWKKTKPKVLIGHTQIYNPAYQKVKTLIKEIGTIKSIDFEGLLSLERDDMSVIWDWGPHPVSLSLDLVQEPVIELSCNASITEPGDKLYKTANIHLLFKNQLKANFRISWLGSQRTRKLIIVGTKGQIIFDDVAEDKKIQIDNQTGIKYPSYDLEYPLIKELEEFILSITEDQKITSDFKLGVEVTKILDLCQQSAANNAESRRVEL